MKKIIGIIILCLAWCEVSFAVSSKSQAIEILSNKKLDNIEGVWRSYRRNPLDFAIINNNGSIAMIAITRGDLFKPGQRAAILRKNSSSTYSGTMYAKYRGQNITANLRMTMYGLDSMNEVNVSSYGTENINWERIWPSDIISHNAKFETPKKKDKPKKITPDPDDNKIVAASSGTGFFVSKTGHIISNHHVVEGCSTVKLTFNGKEVFADVLAADKMNDLAILKANLVPTKIYPIASEDATLLEDIIIAGYPLGKKVSTAIKTSKGSITALAGYGDNYSEFQTDAALNQGNSGGPIMNQKGNVVGVAVANYGKQAGVESFNFGIKSSTLKTFANANGLKFLPANYKDLSNKELGHLITEATIYLECHMTVAKIKRLIAKEENRKAFFSKHKK